MKLEELEAKLAEIKKEASKRRTEEIVKYCKANQKYQVGDIIEDHCSIIMVDSVVYTAGMINLKPECIYRGVKVRKSDFKPFKNGDIDSVYESNVKKHHMRNGRVL